MSQNAASRLISTMMTPTSLPSDVAQKHRIESRIQQLRGQRVLFDADLAELYGVSTKALNQAVKRNANRFPLDFVFQTTIEEKAEVVTNCDHLARLKFSRTNPYVFTEYGAVALANVLASPQAIEMGIYVVRAFVQLRQLTASHQDLAKRLSDLELKAEGLELKQQGINHNTRNQLKQIIETLRELTATTALPPATPEPTKRPIGIIHSAVEK
jgi:hypothetical protein